MAIAKFYQITIIPKTGRTVKDVEEQMNKALDWYRYYNGCYVVYSTSDTTTLMGRFKELVDPNGTLFISELNIINNNGWMPTDFWDWMKKKR